MNRNREVFKNFRKKFHQTNEMPQAVERRRELRPRGLTVFLGDLKRQAEAAWKRAAAQKRSGPGCLSVAPRAIDSALAPHPRGRLRDPGGAAAPLTPALPWERPCNPRRPGEEGNPSVWYLVSRQLGRVGTQNRNYIGLCFIDL